MKELLDENWSIILKNEFQKDYFKNLELFLKDEYKNNCVFPEKSNIFNALNSTSYNDVKIVLLGQDPYHEEGQAHGLSFSVMPLMKIPPSLKNIYKELNSDIGCYIPNNGYLEKWSKQGVLLLNSVLTVRKGLANSHRNIGWQQFTDSIISSLNNKKTPVIFLLWGNYAINKENLITNPIHYIIKSTHPSPLSAYRGFLGSKPFSKSNIILTSNNLTPIDWQIDNI